MSSSPWGRFKTCDKAHWKSSLMILGKLMALHIRSLAVILVDMNRINWDWLWSISLFAGRLDYRAPGLESGLSEPGDLWNGANSIGPLVYSVLKAHTYQRDVDYILRDNTVIILSQNSGRAMEKSRWNEGMHQVIPSDYTSSVCLIASSILLWYLFNISQSWKLVEQIKNNSMFLLHSHFWKLHVNSASKFGFNVDLCDILF